MSSYMPKQGRFERQPARQKGLLPIQATEGWFYNMSMSRSRARFQKPTHSRHFSHLQYLTHNLRRFLVRGQELLALLPLLLDAVILVE